MLDIDNLIDKQIERKYEEKEILKYGSWKQRCKIINERARIKDEVFRQVKEYKNIERIEKMAEKNGIYNNKLTEKTPEWVVCKIGIKVDELPKPNANGYINIDICKSKDGSHFYPKLNEWTPEKKQDEPVVKFNDEEIPF